MRWSVAGVNALAAFFLFGTTMCFLTIVLLVFPGTSLDRLWRLNPDAHAAFASMGGWAIALMAIVGVACLLSAIGLARRASWARALAITVLSVNLLGDLTGAIVRRDSRTLIGLPVAGAMIAFLLCRPVRQLFAERRDVSSVQP